MHDKLFNVEFDSHFSEVLTLSTLHKKNYYLNAAIMKMFPAEYLRDVKGSFLALLTDKSAKLIT